MDSDYNSVSEQAGIYAGNRGFDINVEGNTGLKGAVIDSKAGYEDNTLNTGTITFDDIENKAEYSTSGRGVNVQKTFGNKEGMTDEQKAWEGVTPSTGIGTKDEDESTTKSAIAEARINIMKPENQRQDITKLDRNTTRTLKKIKDPSLRKVAVAITAAMVAKGTGQEAGTAANVAEAIEVYNHLTHKQYEELQKKLKDANNGNAVKAELMEKEEISVQQEQQWFEEHKNDKPLIDAQGNEYYIPVNVGVDVNGNDVYLFPGEGNHKFTVEKNYNVPDTIKNVISKYDYTKLKPGEIYTVSQSASYGIATVQISSSITSSGEVFSNISVLGESDDKIFQKITNLGFGTGYTEGREKILDANGSIVTNHDDIRDTLTGVSLQFGGNILENGFDLSFASNGNRIVAIDNSFKGTTVFSGYGGLSVGTYFGNIKNIKENKK